MSSNKNLAALRTPPRDVGAAIAALTDCFATANLCFGHGTANARDEAAWLVFSILDIPHQRAEEGYRLVIGDSAWRRIRQLATERVETRQPLAYLLNEAWFAGHKFYVDERVLVPRSPMAELIANGFEPWLERERIDSVLDLATGSGCIAIAMALEYGQASVVASDVSAEALRVAARNVAAHGLGRRVQLVESDVFEQLESRRYDLIISNPPYVDAKAMRAIPPEYGHEPPLGLEAGEDGLSIVRKILNDAHKFLTDHGILVVEVGDSELRVDETFDALPFTWLELSDGASGVFLLRRNDLAALQ